MRNDRQSHDPLEANMRRLLVSGQPDESMPDSVKTRILAVLTDEASSTFSYNLKGRLKMKRRMISVGVAVVVAAVVLAAVLLWPAGSGSNKVYAITDVPWVLKTARTLHLKGSAYTVEHDQEDKVHIKKSDFDAWIDQDTGCGWGRSTTYATDTEGKPTQIEERVTGGDYATVLDHIGHTVVYEKSSPFQRQLKAKSASDQFLQQLLGDPRGISDFVRIGQESIREESCAIWQRDIAVTNDQSLRHKVWLSPRTGRVSRMQAWTRSQSDQPWEPAMTIDTVEYDVPVPKVLLQTKAPADYRVIVPKDAAQAPELDMAGGGRLGNLELDLRIGFLLPDGTILMAWRSFDHDARESQASLFENLQVGGPLPKLPTEVYALAPVGPAESINLTGRHLACTHKGGRFFEWSLYVPEKGYTQPAGGILGYRALQRYNPNPPRIKGSLTTGLQGTIPLDTPEDFNRLVPAAMAELSDKGQIPAGITWDSVSRVVAKIRESIANEKAAASQPGEQDLVAYLRKMAEHNGGVFDPAGFNLLEQATGGRTGTWEPSEAETGEAVNALALHTRVMEFARRSEVQIFASGVKLGDAETPIGAWRVRASGKVRVLYGDLHTCDFDPDSLEFTALSELIASQQTKKHQ